MTVVLVDGNNVRRSIWPNVSPDELVERCGTWAREHGREAVVVFDGAESADDAIAARAAELGREGRRFWLVTSDRELRARAGGAAERVVGGGSFVRELLGSRARRA